MLIDNISNEKIQHILILCKPDETELAELYEAYDRNVEGNFPTTDEITFKIPYMITENGRTFHNPNYDLIEGDYLIKYIQKLGNTILQQKFFIISKPKENGVDTDYKEVHGYSREHELNKKLVRNYSFISRQLYSIVNEKDSNGEQRGVLNYISTLSSWSFDTSTIPAKLLNKFRSFDVSEATVLNFLVEEVQPAFGCVFLFDTVNKRISVKELENLGGHNGLYISEQNYLKTIGKEINHEDIVTRLYVYGKDGLSINSMNPTGTPYIENFSFYKQSKFMSQGLINALNNYDNLLKNHKNNNTFENLLTQLQQLQNEKLTLEGQLLQLNNELNIIQDNIDSRIKLGQNYADLNTQKNNKQTQINNKQNEINDKQTQITSKINEIKNFNNLIKKENNFTSDQIRELDYYVREKVWIDNSYETVEELYEEAENKIVNLCSPPMQFNIEMVDFLDIAEGKIDRRKFNMGNIVTVGFKKFNINVDVRFIGYSHGLDNNNLTMRFSNTNSIDDPYILLAELQKNAITTSTSIDMSKFKWDKSVNNESLIKQIIDGELETSAKRVLAARDQGVVVDDRGIWLTEKNPDGTAKPEQMRIINNLLVISEDGFNSAKLAISPRGVVAERVFGTLLAGTNLIIDASNSQGQKTFTVDSSGVKIRGASLTIEGGLGESNLSQDFLNKIDTDIDGARKAISDLESDIGVTLSDNKLTSIEANELKRSLSNLETEANNLIATATNLGITTEKNNYNNAIFHSTTGLKPYLNNNFLVNKTYPLDIANSQRTEINNRIQNVMQTKNILINKIDEVKEENIRNDVILKGRLYNGVKVDADSGLVVTRSDNRVRSTFNATEGIKVETRTTSNGTWRNSFYFDANTSNLIIDGEINARAMKINGANVLTSNGAQISGQYIDKIKVEQLDATSAKITTAMIENLVVGSNVQMGANAVISWSQVSSKPSIPSTAADVGALASNSTMLTHISSNGIYTGSIIASQITAGVISADRIATNIAQVNDTLNIGNSGGSGYKGIVFRNGMSIYRNANSDTLRISASRIEIDDGTVVLGSNSYIGSVSTNNRIATIGDIGSVTAKFG